VNLEDMTLAEQGSAAEPFGETAPSAGFWLFLIHLGLVPQAIFFIIHTGFLYWF